MKSNIKELITNGDYIVVFDTNVYLNIYRYSPEFTYFALECLECVKNNIVIPATVAFEFNKHKKEAFHAMKKRVENASRDILNQVNSSKQKIINTCKILKDKQYPDIDTLEKSLLLSIEKMFDEINNFFDDRDVLKQIAIASDKEDPVSAVFEEIAKTKKLKAFSMEELYNICDEGEKRYADSTPPGYKDAKDKDGIRKYSDLIIWKEILKYSKDNKKNVILVTDDVKKDWWEEKNIFHRKLVDEFNTYTGNQILAFNSIEFFNNLSESFEIEKSDAIEIALKLTDDLYFERVAEDVFYSVESKIAYNSEDYIDPISSHIGTEGIAELEILEHALIEAYQVERLEELMEYCFVYEIEAEGTSFNYYGRDDDTKEIYLSPGAYHKFRGRITVSVFREIETFIDYSYDDSFSGARIINGNLEEIEYKESYFDDYNPDAYTTCPRCGCPISYSNDAGNGFCIECTNQD